MREFVEYIVKSVVDNPDEVEITEVQGSRTIVYEVRVGDSDLGKVIG